MATEYQSHCKECDWVGDKISTDNPKTPTPERAKNKSEAQAYFHYRVVHEKTA